LRGDQPTVRVLRVEVSGSNVDVFLSGAGDLPDVADLEEQLSAAFGTPTSVLVEYAPTILVSCSDAEGLAEISPGS
jgi:hypothetical protein